MGAWDTGIFDNDAACDWAGDFEENPTIDFINSTLDEAISEADEYLDSDLACQALAAAEAVARAKGKWGQKSPYSESVDKWAERQNVQISSNLIQKCIQVIDLTLGDNSELNELWAEAGDDYDVWRSELLDLKARLLS
jgi:hypothetical protein